MSDEGEGPAYQLQVEGEDAPRDTSKHFDGVAKATYSNADIYEGNFAEGKRSGDGTYTFAKTGDVYTGNYFENERSGEGDFIFKDSAGFGSETEEDPEANLIPRGGKYSGTWKYGKRAGQGVFAYINGDSYDGEWLAGLKHGKGTYVYGSDGTTLSGYWEKGDFVRGKWTLPTGVYYQGTFKWNQPDGKGVWVFPSTGNQLVGSFKQVTEFDEDDEGPADDEENPGAEEVIKRPTSVTVSWASQASVAVRG